MQSRSRQAVADTCRAWAGRLRVIKGDLKHAIDMLTKQKGHLKDELQQAQAKVVVARDAKDKLAAAARFAVRGDKAELDFKEGEQQYADPPQDFFFMDLFNTF